MPGIEGIIRTLMPPGKSADASILSEGMKLISASGQQLVSISLMSNIPNEHILGRIEHIVDSHSQLYYTEAWRQMPSSAGNGLDDPFPDLLTQHGKIIRMHILEIFRTVYGV
jgi:hypothetical protein